jgi:hypothetical protein
MVRRASNLSWRGMLRPKERPRAWWMRRSLWLRRRGILATLVSPLLF